MKNNSKQKPNFLNFRFFLPNTGIRFCRLARESVPATQAQCVGSTLFDTLHSIPRRVEAGVQTARVNVWASSMTSLGGFLRSAKLYFRNNTLRSTARCMRYSEECGSRAIRSEIARKTGCKPHKNDGTAIKREGEGRRSGSA